MGVRKWGSVRVQRYPHTSIPPHPHTSTLPYLLMMETYIPILILALFSALIAGGLLLLTSILGPKRPTKTKLEPFESGVQPLQTSVVRIPVKFYIVAILFILFDIEIIFLFPWATVFRELGVFGFIEMVVFLLMLVAGLIYAWKKGALEWE